MPHRNIEVVSLGYHRHLQNSLSDQIKQYFQNNLTTFIFAAKGKEPLNNTTDKEKDFQQHRSRERETVWLMCKELAARRQKTPLRTSDQKSEQKKVFSTIFFSEQASENASCNWPLFLFVVLENKNFFISEFLKCNKSFFKEKLVLKM